MLLLHTCSQKEEDDEADGERPHTPTFYTEDMQQIIEDKIKLKAQVHELEDEMKDLKLWVGEVGLRISEVTGGLLRKHALWVMLSNTCLSTNTILVTHQNPVIQTILPNKHIYTASNHRVTIFQLVVERLYVHCWKLFTWSEVCLRERVLGIPFFGIKSRELIICTNLEISAVETQNCCYVHTSTSCWVCFKLSRSKCQLPLPYFTLASSSSAY